MKKSVNKKTTIIFILAFIFVQIFSPLNNTEAASKLNWDNPNSGRNAYKFKLSDYLNSQMVMQVVGCTGVVDKVSGTLSKLMSGNVEDIKWIWAGKKEKILEAQCMLMAMPTITALGSAPNLTVSNVPKTVAEYCQTKKTANKELEKLAKDSLNVQKSTSFTEQCLNGIAYTIAKNQLTAMTKQTMNWVTSGFEGDPMYVRNTTNFMNSIENTILNTELNMFRSVDGTYRTEYYPYIRDISQVMMNSRQSALNFQDSMRQDLTNYLVDEAGKEINKSGSDTEKAIYAFSKDFSRGGWNGWLALTQHNQNNPLGATMDTVQRIAEKQTEEAKNTAEELTRNRGILDQKKCKITEYQKRENEIKSDRAKLEQELRGAQSACEGTEATDLCDYYYELLEKQNDFEINANNLESSEKCAEYETVTPGSLIQDKVSNYLNSPERQLEIADDINAVLNTLFANLINKLRIDGLSSLNSENEEYKDTSSGWGSNRTWTTPVDLTDVEGNQFSGSGFDENRPFDLTKDLGNIYNHKTKTNLGNWDAKKNEVDGDPTKKLSLGNKPPEDFSTKTAYYTVAFKGNTKLFNDGYNVWDVGDRAFWDGKSWQNWKKGQTSPIVQRGIIQLQQDYIVVARELLGIVPGVMPALGELDYCIPGPNPSWQTNSTNAYEAFTEYVSDLKTNYVQAGQIAYDVKALTIDAPSENPNGIIYKTYKAVFEGSNLWPKVEKTDTIRSIHGLAIYNPTDKKWYEKLAYVALGPIFGGIVDLSTKNDNIWDGIGPMSMATQAVLDLSTEIMDRLRIFDENYPGAIRGIYGTIEDKYLEYEEVSSDHPSLKEPNPQYLPMAKDGLTLTKKMLIYDEEITDAKEDLRLAINEADENIAELDLIRKKVNSIIKAAQDRRDGAITDALNKEAEEKCEQTKKEIELSCREGLLVCNSNESPGSPTRTGTINCIEDIYKPCLSTTDCTIKRFNNNTAYKIPYAQCLEEENIDYLDYEDIIVSESDRCWDKVDNDFDGLIDGEDPDCEEAIQNKGENTKTECSDGVDNDEDRLKDEADPQCYEYYPKYYKLSSCIDEKYYQTGPWPIGTFTFGSRVEGTNSDDQRGIYKVLDWQENTYSLPAIIDTYTYGETGCPQ